MDSVTQFALGGGVGMAMLGRHIGVGKAALTGGLLGSLPDADVFWQFEDPIDSFVLHRGATHSLVMQALVTPPLAEALIRVISCKVFLGDSSEPTSSRRKWFRRGLIEVPPMPNLMMSREFANTSKAHAPNTKSHYRRIERRAPAARVNGADTL